MVILGHWIGCLMVIVPICAMLARQLQEDELHKEDGSICWSNILFPPVLIAVLIGYGMLAQWLITR